MGAHVLLELATTGRSVKALQRPGTDGSVVERIFTHYRPDAKALLERIHWVPGDILDMPSLADAMAGVTHVYHAAAMVSFDPSDVPQAHAEGERGRHGQRGERGLGSRGAPVVPRELGGHHW